MQAYVDVKTVSLLTGEDRRRIWERVDYGEYVTQRQSGVRGGNSGESYLISMASLPKEAQIIYLEHGGSLQGPVSDSCDLAAYRERFGEAGIKELLEKQQTAREGMAIRRMNTVRPALHGPGQARVSGSSLPPDAGPHPGGDPGGRKDIGAPWQESLEG